EKRSAVDHHPALADMLPHLAARDSAFRERQLEDLPAALQRTALVTVISKRNVIRLAPRDFGHDRERVLMVWLVFDADLIEKPAPARERVRREPTSIWIESMFRPEQVRRGDELSFVHLHHLAAAQACDFGDVLAVFDTSLEERVDL